MVSAPTTPPHDPGRIAFINALADRFERLARSDWPGAVDDWAAAFAAALGEGCDRDEAMAVADQYVSADTGNRVASAAGAEPQPAAVPIAGTSLPLANVARPRIHRAS